MYSGTPLVGRKCKTADAGKPIVRLREASGSYLDALEWPGGDLAVPLSVFSCPGKGNRRPVPRLPLVDPDDPGADPKAAALLGLVRAGLSANDDLPWTDINVYRSMANHPEVFEAALTLMDRAYLRSGLTPAQRELAYLGASVANDCHY